MFLPDRSNCWNLFGPDLLHTYDIPGLPPDNLQIESLFGRLRRHQRRVSGRKSTRPLREFGHYQVLFSADSQADLLQHLRTVPLDVYRKHRQQLRTLQRRVKDWREEQIQGLDSQQDESESTPLDMQ